MAEPLRWGLLSTADINRALIAPLRQSPRHRLAAVASRSREKAEAYAREWDIPLAHGSYEALIDDPEIDVIYNPLPNHMHAEWTIKAVEAGKHVLVEKPIALSAEEVDAMAAAAKKHDRVVAEAFMYRHHPQTLKVEEYVKSGGLGRVQVIKGGLTTLLGRPGNYRYDPAMGGGAIWDVGCYPISFTRMLTGVEPVEVFGWQVKSDSGVDLTFVGQMRFPGDVYGQFECGFTAPYRGYVEVIALDGILRMTRPFHPGTETTELKVEVLRGSGAVEAMAMSGDGPYLGEVEDMADAILEGKPQRVSLADSRGNVAAIRALMQSAETGRPMTV